MTNMRAKPTCSVEGCAKPLFSRGFCNAHYANWKRNGVPDTHRFDVPGRFWRKVNKDGPLSDRRPDLGPCWVWTAQLNRGGYGAFKLEGRTRPAHRISYEMLVGPIPAGMEIDHLCFTRSCVNIRHLEPVTPQVNQWRSGSASGTNAARAVCVQGHEFTPENTYVTPDGRRQCRTCNRARGAAFHSAARERH